MWDRGPCPLLPFSFTFRDGFTNLGPCSIQMWFGGPCPLLPFSFIFRDGFTNLGPCSIQMWFGGPVPYFLSLSLSATDLQIWGHVRYKCGTGPCPLLHFSFTFSRFSMSFYVCSGGVTQENVQKNRKKMLFRMWCPEICGALFGCTA